MPTAIVDSDIFVTALRYPDDCHAKDNNEFLHLIQIGKIKGYTTYFNVLEVCGILSFNLPMRELQKLYEQFCQKFNVKVLYPSLPSGEFQYEFDKIFKLISNKQGLGDAQVSYIANRFADDVDAFVSWNAKHFKDKLLVEAMTPKEFQSLATAS